MPNNFHFYVGKDRCGLEKKKTAANFYFNFIWRKVVHYSCSDFFPVQNEGIFELSGLWNTYLTSNKTYCNLRLRQNT